MSVLLTFLIFTATINKAAAGAVLVLRLLKQKGMRAVIDKDRLYETIGEQLKAVRKKNYLTQADMADILGLERTSVTNIELGKQRPGVHVLYRCCEYFEIPIAEFLPSVKSVAQSDLPPGAARIIEEKRRRKRANSEDHEELTHVDT